MEDIDAFQYSSDCFAHTLRYVVHVENCRNYIEMYQCPSIAGEGHEKAHNYGTDSGQVFRTFSPQLENNDTLKCNSDSFAHTLRYVVHVENCQNYIEMY